MLHLNRRRTGFSWEAMALAGMLAATLAGPTRVTADTHYYVGANNSGWGVAGNWSSTSGGPGGFGVPTTDDVAILDYPVGGDTNVRFGTESAFLDSLTIDGMAGVWMSLEEQYASSYFMTHGAQMIGINGWSEFSQVNGSNYCNATMYLGNLPLSQGRYFLFAGSLQTGTLEVGSAAGGVGVFTQNGGTHTIYNSTPGPDYGLSINNATSAYHLKTSAWLITPAIYVPTGTFDQQGGTNWGDIVSISGTGSYQMLGGTLSSKSITMTGGVFNQTGGTIDSTTFNHSGGEVQGVLQNQGSYIYNGGTFTGQLNNTGAVTLNGNTWTVGNGVYNHSATTLDIPAGKTVTLNGAGLINDGTMTQEGTLTSNLAYIGNVSTGSFTQNSGTHTVNNTLSVGDQTGSNGSYTMASGATLTVNGYEHIGNNGTGTFTQNGGTHNSNTWLRVTNGSGSGSYNMNGGNLYPAKMSVGYGSNGTFTQTNGTVSTTQFITLGDGSAAQGTYNLNGGSVGAGFLFVGWSGTGIMNHNTTTFNYIDNIYIGHESIGTGTYNLSKVSKVSVYYDEYVGFSGTGTFNDTGYNEVTGHLYIGYNPGSHGTYNVNFDTPYSGALTATRGIYISGTPGVAGGTGQFQIGTSAADIEVGNTFYLGAGANYWAVSGTTIRMQGASWDNRVTDATQVESRIYDPVHHLFVTHGLPVTTFIFEGGSTVMDVEAAGQDYGASTSGYTNNFAFGTLQLGDTGAGRIRLVDNVDNRPSWVGSEALYVGTLVINVGATIDLNGLHLYYQNGGAVKRFFQGDANLDGKVSVGDLGILASHYGASTGATWATGDFNGDGAVSVGDLGILAANYGSVTAAAVPEPALLTTLVAGALALLRRRGRR